MKIKLNNKILTLKKLELNDENYFSFKPQFQFISCEYAFSNLFLWSDSYPVKWTDYDGTPLIYSELDDFLFFPLKNNLPYQLHDLSNAFIEAGGSGIIAYLPLEYINNHPDLKNLFLCTENRSLAEYIHLSEKLVKLSGRKLSKKKNHISQFYKKYQNVKNELITPENIEKCLELSLLNAVDSNQNHSEEILALKKAINHFVDLNLDGMMLIVDSKCAAFSIFSKHIDGSCLIHFEKSDYAFKGASQVINKIIAEYLVEKYNCTHINREQDLGVEGLRKNKLSYDPDILFKNYFLAPL